MQPVAGLGALGANDRAVDDAELGEGGDRDRDLADSFGAAVDQDGRVPAVGRPRLERPFARAVALGYLDRPKEVLRQALRLGQQGDVGVATHLYDLPVELLEDH